MTTILLVRHASGDHVGRVLAGRTADAPLNDRGREEAERLAARLEGRGIGAVYASPLARARDTAAPLARQLGLDVREAPAATELDYGAWTGRAWQELDGDATWRAWNAFRGGTRIPGGETMLEVQARAVGLLLDLRDRHAGEIVAVVTHGDVIRAAAGFFLGMPVDLLLRLDVDPASVTEIALHDDGVRVVSVNERLR